MLVLLRSANAPFATLDLFLIKQSAAVSFRTHQGQTVHTWPPSYSGQIPLQIPVLPSLSESYSLPALPQLPRGPEGLKESRLQEKDLRNLVWNFTDPRLFIFFFPSFFLSSLSYHCGADVNVAPPLK